MGSDPVVDGLCAKRKFTPSLIQLQLRESPLLLTQPYHADFPIPYTEFTVVPFFFSFFFVGKFMQYLYFMDFTHLDLFKH